MRTTRELTLAALIATSGHLSAQTSSIAMTTLPGPLTIIDAVPGGQPRAQTDQAARYSVNVTTGRMKIAGQLDTPLPPGVTLTIQLSAPSGATSVGAVALGTSPQDLVRFISPGQRAGLPVTLVLSASITAGVIPYTASHVVLTLVDDP
jgi:hypothetical protein